MVYQTLLSSSFPALGPARGASFWKPGHGEVLTSAAGRGVKTWNLEHGGPGLKTFRTYVEMRQVFWSKDGNLFATLGRNEVVVWKSDGSRLSTLQLDPEVFMLDFVHRQYKKHRLESIEFNASGRLLALLENGTPGFVHVFDAVTGISLKTVSAGIPADRLTITPSFAWKDEINFFCGGHNKITHFKDGQDRPVQVLRGMMNSHTIDMTFNEESGMLASCGGSGVELWSPSQPRIIFTDIPVMEVMWHPQNATILAGRLSQVWCQTGNFKCGVRLWDTSSKTILLEIIEDVKPTAPYNDRAFSMAGLSLTGSSAPYNGIAFSPDWRFLAMSNVNVSVWKVSTGKKVAVCKTEGGESAQVSWSPSGEKLAVNVDSNNSVSVFNMEKIVTMNLKTLYDLSMIRVAECFKGSKKNGPYDVEKLLREQEVPGKLVKEIKAYLE